MGGTSPALELNARLDAEAFGRAHSSWTCGAIGLPFDRVKNASADIRYGNGLIGVPADLPPKIAVQMMTEVRTKCLGTSEFRSHRSELHN